MPIAPGSRLGSYEIVSTLGVGGMGAVYRAYDSRLQRTVAVKVLNEGVDERGRPLLLQEARAASALSHPHICVVYEVGEADGRTFIAMEYVDGKPLSELIPVNGLPADNVMRYGAQIADALTHAASFIAISRARTSSSRRTGWRRLSTSASRDAWRWRRPTCRRHRTSSRPGPEWPARSVTWRRKCCAVSRRRWRATCGASACFCMK